MPGAIAFTLYGPLSSWGTEHAASEERPSAERPTKSGVIGLVAACLGIDRSNRAEIADLSERLALGVLTVRAGFALSDYHTVETAPTRKIQSKTRRQEVLSGTTATTITRRGYRQDALHVAAVRDIGGVDLGRIAAAMQSPVFFPYLGRKSCPLALPLDPVVTGGDDIGADLVAYVRRLVAKEVIKLPMSVIGILATDASFAVSAPGALVIERRDAMAASPRGFVPRRETVTRIEFLTKQEA